MTGSEVQVAGRVVALEFVLELMLANGLAVQPLEKSEAFRERLRSEKAYMRQVTFDPEQSEAIAAEAKAFMQRFVEKVARREAEFRRRIS